MADRWGLGKAFLMGLPHQLPGIIRSHCIIRHHYGWMPAWRFPEDQLPPSQGLSTLLPRSLLPSTARGAEEEKAGSQTRADVIPAEQQAGALAVPGHP